MRGDNGTLTRHLQGSRRQLEFAAACNLCLGMLVYYRIVLLSGIFLLGSLSGDRRQGSTLHLFYYLATYLNVRCLLWTHSVYSVRNQRKPVHGCTAWGTLTSQELALSDTPHG